MINFAKKGEVLVFTFNGKLVDEDYKKILIPEIENAVQHTKETDDTKGLRVAIILGENFDGVSVKAIIDDIIFGFKHRKDFEKIGISGKHYKIQDKLIKIPSKIIPGEIQVFLDQDEMYKWLS